MKLATAFLALFGVQVIANEAASAPLSQPRLLDCVKEIENTRRDFVSKSGARGIYQMKRKTWEQWSDTPHKLANADDPGSKQTTYNVALKQAAWILQSGIPALKLPATPYSFALLWFAGYGNADRLNLTPENVDAAKRFENLYLDKTFR